VATLNVKNPRPDALYRKRQARRGEASAALRRPGVTHLLSEALEAPEVPVDPGLKGPGKDRSGRDIDAGSSERERASWD